MDKEKNTIPIFCCYARKDRDLLEELKMHLMSLQRQNVIQVWHDGDISAGKEWDREIKKYLNEAKIILLLMSSDFIASDYCYSTEMKHALERYEQGDANVIPVILRPVAWRDILIGNIKLGNLQALPKDVRPVTTWENCDEAWTDVTEKIGRVANELQKDLSMSQHSTHLQQLPDPESVAQREAKTPSHRQKQSALDNIGKVVPGVDISLYYDTFGKPTFINHTSFSMNPNDEMRKFIEYVFVDTYFYLDVIADPQGKVLYFAVTIRDKSFNPLFKN